MYAHSPDIFSGLWNYISTTSSVWTSHKHLNLTYSKLNSRSTHFLKIEEIQWMASPSTLSYEPGTLWLCLNLSTINLPQPIYCQTPFPITDLLSLKYMHPSISFAIIQSTLLLSVAWVSHNLITSLSGAKLVTLPIHLPCNNQYSLFTQIWYHFQAENLPLVSH